MQFVKELDFFYVLQKLGMTQDSWSHLFDDSLGTNLLIQRLTTPESFFIVCF